MVIDLRKVATVEEPHLVRGNQPSLREMLLLTRKRWFILSVDVGVDLTACPSLDEEQNG